MVHAMKAIEQSPGAHEMKIGDQFKLIGRANIFSVVRIECRNGAFGPQLVGQDAKYQTKVLARHEGYTFERVSA